MSEELNPYSAPQSERVRSDWVRRLHAEKCLKDNKALMPSLLLTSYTCLGYSIVALCHAASSQTLEDKQLGYVAAVWLTAIVTSLTDIKLADQNKEFKKIIQESDKASGISR